VPDASLTKEGFQILLATFCDVFPQVELWSGQSGDVLILASPSRGPHDLANLRAAYDDPILQLGFDRAWVASPAVLLSHFLIDDASVRRIAATRIHREGDDSLRWQECARRMRLAAVNPVPGLVEIRGDVLAAFAGPADESFANEVQDAIRARDLESDGIDRELAKDDYGAVDAYDTALELSPSDGSVRRALATLRSRMGVQFMTRMSEQGAYQNLRESVAVDSTYAQGFANLGTLLFTAESWDYAVAVIQKAISLAPNDDLYELLLGRTFKRQGMLEESLPHYERSMALNPRNVDAALGFVDAKLALQRPTPDLQLGLDVLERYVAIEPNNETLRNRIGRLRDYQAGGLPSSAPDDALPGLFDAGDGDTEPSEIGATPDEGAPLVPGEGE
jgi:hypothetical protein